MDLCLGTGSKKEMIGLHEMGTGSGRDDGFMLGDRFQKGDDGKEGTGSGRDDDYTRGQVQDEMMTIHGDRFRRDRRAYMGTGLEEVSRNKSSEKIRT